MGMSRLVFFLVMGSFLALMPDVYSEPYTPKRGSPERVAIADSLRDYMAKKWVEGKLAKKMVFQIDWLKVDRGFAYIACRPIYEDGTEICSTILPPIDYAFLLQKRDDGWKVIADFSMSDVPPPSWWQEIKRGFPPGVPAGIFPEYPKEQLGL